MIWFFSHSWTWDQKQATWGQYQNKWLIDSVSSQQNLQGFGDFMPQIFKILLVTRILYNNLSWKAQSLESCIVLYINSYTLYHGIGTSKISSQLFFNLYGTVVNILVLKWNWYTFLFMLFVFLRNFWSFILGRQTSSCYYPPPPFLGQCCSQLVVLWWSFLINLPVISNTEFKFII